MSKNNVKRTDITKNILKELYVKDKLSIYEIGDKLNCAGCTIGRYLQKYKIPIRDTKFQVNDNYFDTLNNEKAWLIGLLAADGCITNTGRLQLSQSGDKGLKLLQYVKKILEFKGNITTTVRDFKNKPTIIKYSNKKYIQHYIYIRSDKLINKLSQYNIVERKSLIYDFPEKIIPFLNSFIRGYVDGDGSIGIYSKPNDKSKRLTITILGTHRLLSRLNELVKIKGNLKIKSGNKQLWKLTWYGEKAVNFCKVLYKNDNLYQYYKKDIFIQYLKYLKNK